MKTLFVCSTKIFYNNMRPAIPELQSRGIIIKVMDFTPLWKIKEVIEKHTPRRMNRGMDRFKQTGYIETKNTIKTYHKIAARLIARFLLKDIDSLLVISDFNPIEKCFVLAAKQKNIPTILCVFTGFLPADYVREDFLTDYFMVQCSTAFKGITNNNISPDRVFIVGRPIWNHIHKTEYRDNSVFRIVYLSEHFPLDMTKDVFNRLCRHLHRLQGRLPVPCDIIVRPHPDEGHQYLRLFKKTAEKHKLDITIIRDYDLNNCDLVIIGFSSAAVESLILNKPVISFNCFKKSYPIPFVEYDAVLYAEDDKTFLQTLQYVYRNNVDSCSYLQQGQRRFLKDYCEMVNTGDEMAKALQGIKHK